ncbi:MAG: cytochrome c3 family protein [Myxococcota bacterium]
MSSPSVTSSSRFIRALAVLSLAGAAACVQPGKQPPPVVPDPVVTITGEHGVVAGETLTLSAATENAEDSGYTWAVLDATVASVSSDGVVTGVLPGETTVTATGLDTGVVGRHALVVVPTAAELPPEVTITGEHGVVVGQTTTLTAATTHGSDSGYTWTSLDTAVATVDAAGLVTAVAAGETSVTATGNDTGVVAHHALVIIPVASAPGPVVPNYVAWSGSAHANKNAEAFKHWNNDDPPVVPIDCARCHSNLGFQDFIGEDGTAVGSVEKAQPVGSTVECATCHNATTAAMTSVTFPSGVVVDGLGPESRCMTCHQGRASTTTVDDAITLAAAKNDDTPSDKLSFLNIHYYAAGATLYAGKVKGGYQYAGQTYDWRFRHVEGLNTCVGCHDPHSLKVRVDRCVECHKNVTTIADAKNIRMMASMKQDYDGDGNLTEGIYFELEGLRERLLAALRAYTTGEGFGAVCYSADIYPYWFKDTDDNGTCSAEEAAFANRFVTWTPRLVRAAYNYQVSLKDPGAFAHNAKYIMQLLHDSVSDIATGIGQPALLGSAVRNDFGHFNGASEAARHWDADETVVATCSKCHGGSEGFRFYLRYGVGTDVLEPDNGLDCATCHDNLSDTFELAKVPSVSFPSGITLPSADNITNLCSTCHVGRESKSTIDSAIAKNQLGFKNVHYLPAASVRQGTAAKVGYEYEGKTYAGPWIGHPGGDGCISCHNAKVTQHSFRIADNIASCEVCHTNVTNYEDIRSTTRHAHDFDGDGSQTEPLKDEIAGLSAKLLAQMQTVASASGTPGLCYEGTAYPYFFLDTNGNGRCDGASETASSNGFNRWSAPLMKAAHNYQISIKDPGAWSHNFDYVAELLIDSIADLGGSTSNLIRP